MEKKAVFYARVSTLSSEQETSIEAQISLCKVFLQNNPDYILAEPIETYVEKVSGKNDLRNRYDAMMKRIAASNGDIQYIIVKDLYRLSRSSEVSSGIKRFCKNYGVKLILLANTGCEEYDPSAEENRLLYGIQSLLAEEYVYNQSKLARLSHAQKMAEKRLNRNNIVMGYRWNEESNDIEIDEKDIKIIQRVYELYVFNNKGEKTIAETIYLEYGLLVSNNTIRKWLTDTSYIGKFAMNKTTTVLGVGKGDKSHRYKNDPSEYVIVERPDLTTIDERLFNLAQRIRKRRLEHLKADKNGIKQERFKGTSLFASKIVCACGCGNTYYMRHADRKSEFAIYKCSNTLKKNTQPCCNSFNRIPEEDLIKIIIRTIREYSEKNRKLNAMLLGVIKRNIKADNIEKKIKTIKKNIDYNETQLNKYRDAYINETNDLLKADIHEQYLNMLNKYNSLKLELEDEMKNKETDVMEMIEARLDKVDSTISSLNSISELDRNLVESFIRNIYIKTNGDIDIILNGYGKVFLSKDNESTEASFKKIQLHLFSFGYDFIPFKRIIRKESGYITKTEKTINVNVFFMI